jgi:hypothetical protein
VSLFVLNLEIEDRDGVEAVNWGKHKNTYSEWYMYMIVLYYVFPVNIIVEIIRNIVELNPFFHNNYLSKEMMYGVSWECQI